MKPVEVLEQKVRALYEAREPERADWADWLYDHHVFVVCDYAKELARRFGAREDLSYAAAILHDIADVKMKREDETHGEESLAIARQLMKESGFGDQDIKLVVDDAIQYHSCHEGVAPESLEGKVLATADSLAHLKSDFYVYGTRMFDRKKSLNDVKAWVLKKVERDFHDKIQFDEVRQEVTSDYEMIKELFSR